MSAIDDINRHLSKTKGTLELNDIIKKGSRHWQIALCKKNGHIIVQYHRGAIINEEFVINKTDEVSISNFTDTFTQEMVRQLNEENYTIINLNRDEMIASLKTMVSSEKGNIKLLKRMPWNGFKYDIVLTVAKDRPGQPLWLNYERYDWHETQRGESSSGSLKGFTALFAKSIYKEVIKGNFI